MLKPHWLGPFDDATVILALVLDLEDRCAAVRHLGASDHAAQLQVDVELFFLLLGWQELIVQLVRCQVFLVRVNSEVCVLVAQAHESLLLAMEESAEVARLDDQLVGF